MQDIMKDERNKTERTRNLDEYKQEEETKSSFISIIRKKFNKENIIKIIIGYALRKILDKATKIFDYIYQKNI